MNQHLNTIDGITPIEPFANVKRRMASGDLLLFRPAHWNLITKAGRSPYSHAGMVVRKDGDPYVAEMVFAGGHVVDLYSQVRNWPGQWEWRPVSAVFESQFDRESAADDMEGFAKEPYGRKSLVKAAIIHLPIVRLFIKPDVDDGELHRYPPFCSQAVSRAAMYGGGVDPVNGLAHRLTEPADLSRSLLWRAPGRAPGVALAL